MEIGVMKISQILSQEITYWNTMLDTIKRSNEISDNLPEEIIEKLVHSIAIFDDFKNKYANFFISDIDKINLPVDWFIFRLEQTLLDYWEPIKRAVNHSIHYPVLIKNGSEQLEKYKEKLEITKDIPAILYFDKVPRALRIPFGPIMFIGIPLTDAYREDWNAIPHELGHHVFWNSQFVINDYSVIPYQAPARQTVPVEPKEKVFDSLIQKSTDHAEWPPERKQEIQGMLNQWSEEIFAEVLGVKMAGDDFVEAAWRKALNYIKKPEDAIYNDGKHPVPFLLPFIRKCAIGKSPDIKAYKSEFQELIGKDKELVGPKLDLMEATKDLVDKLSTNTQTLKPIISSELNPFEKLSEFLAELPGNNIIEKLIQPMILEGALIWTCVCHNNNDINLDFCVRCNHPIPWGYKALRILLP